MNKLINIQGLAKHYDSFDLQGVNLEVPAGSVVGFIGGNGAGKTTTIKAMLGLIIPDAGTIELFGTSCNQGASSKNATALKQRIGVVFDTCAYPEELTVAKVGSIMKAAYPDWNGALFNRYLTSFGLSHKKTVKELSRGMGMKLTLACAFSHNPDLLILDEPTAGLDPLARDEVLDILRDFMKNENHGILMSSHITTDLEKIADYLVCIDKGRIVFALEKDVITDLAGIARCRMADFEKLTASGFFKTGTLRSLKHEYGIDVLVEDRFAFAQTFKDIALDKASIDDYMTLRLKGGIQ